MFFSPSRKSIIARWYFPEENKTDHRETRISGPVWGLEDNFLGGGWGQESWRRVLLRQLDDSQYLEWFLLKHLLISADLPEKTPVQLWKTFFLKLRVSILTDSQKPSETLWRNQWRIVNPSGFWKPIYVYGIKVLGAFRKLFYDCTKRLPESSELLKDWPGPFGKIRPNRSSSKTYF
jgi:hypothetical protein